MNTVSTATDIGTLAQASAATALIRQQINILTAQTSSNLIAPTYDGLGTGAGLALDLTSQLAQNSTAQANTDTAATVAQVTQTALGQIETLASSFAASLTTASTTGASSIDALATSARSTLQQVASLLNTKVGDVYVFAGQDSANPPVPNAANITSSNFFTTIAAAVANLDTSGASGVETTTLTASGPGATSPFSATLEASNQPATVDIGGGVRVQTGILADQNTDAVSAGTGTTSTGSYTRDLLRSLATIGSLTSAQSTDPQFETLLQNTLSDVQSATSALNTDIAGLGTRQDRLTSAKTELGDTATALATQLSNLQEINLAQVATELSAAQTQLQASYQLIATLGQLSLAKYLPA